MLKLSQARSNFFVSLKLLEGFNAKGLEYIVLCPGSRSGPLAMAAAALKEFCGIKLLTSIDERSGAFLALGISAANGKATLVITTSGTAVANLLPAAVEADRSCHPLLFLTADRPLRLKNCGANQTVNQEAFLKPVCRVFEQTPKLGLHLTSQDEINQIVDLTWNKVHLFPGPAHINVPIEEPLCPSTSEQKDILSEWALTRSVSQSFSFKKPDHVKKESEEIPFFDLFHFGVIIVGPWRGSNLGLPSFKDALRKFQKLTGWPIFADPLSGIGIDQVGLIHHWEFIILSDLFFDKKSLQVLRLGPLTASKTLESWIASLDSKQILITEGDQRTLDPLRKSIQWSGGFACWFKKLIDQEHISLQTDKNEADIYTKKLLRLDSFINSWLDKELKLMGGVSEPALARWLPKLLPRKYPVMISASSPIRDFITYSGPGAYSRRYFGFRGASGIDGTLSLGMGLSIVKGNMILITGDLSLLHDTNGWLFSSNSHHKLIIVLIDNSGGGIFNQLSFGSLSVGDFEQIFKMPQQVSYLKLAEAFGVPFREVLCLEDIEASIKWADSLSKTVLIRVCTDSSKDTTLRMNLKNEFLNHLKSFD